MHKPHSTTKRGTTQNSQKTTVHKTQRSTVNGQRSTVNGQRSKTTHVLLEAFVEKRRSAPGTSTPRVSTAHRLVTA
eukprot:1670355-Rhodomonas_salina.1